MIKISTIQRDQKIVKLLENKKVTPKEARMILYRQGIVVSLWTIYKAHENISKLSKRLLIRFWS